VEFDSRCTGRADARRSPGAGRAWWR